MSRPDTKIRILAEAEQIVLERGVSAPTLDAVAEAAGFSKGGLIYHFDSKRPGATTPPCSPPMPRNTRPGSSSRGRTGSNGSDA